jgi:hypothetical protein
LKARPCTYFAKALRNDDGFSFAEGASDILRFKHDDVDCWKVFVSWVVRRVLPGMKAAVDRPSKSNYESLLVRSWALGDKYCAPDFQDLIMLELLAHYEKTSTSLELENVYAGFSATPPGSILRKLLADEVVYHLENTDEHAKNGFDPDKLDVCDGIPGCANAIVRSLQASKARGSTQVSRFYSRGGSGDKVDLWKECLIGQGPSQHWVYTDKIPWKKQQANAN